MTTYNYKLCRFIHKDEKGKYVIHQVNKSIELNSCETYAKELISAKESHENGIDLIFIQDENKLIQRKMDEREEGKRTSERYLILK